jgi:hypothetical protein
MFSKAHSLAELSVERALIRASILGIDHCGWASVVFGGYFGAESWRMGLMIVECW